MSVNVVKDNFFERWKNIYKNTSNIEVTDNLQGNFCWFLNTYDVINAIKLYIPMDFSHLNEGAIQLFDFIVNTNMLHQSKISRGIRSDDVVSRVTSMEDAMKIIDFVSSNKYIKEGMLNVNPFLPNINGIGITMDSKYSFNGELSSSIAEFIEFLKLHNRLDLATVEEYNKFIKNKINYTSDLELKDIYILLSKTTSRDFKIEDFLEFANDKLLNEYDENRNRIVDPGYYLENAININEKYYPGNAKLAILNLLNANYNGFTRKENVRSIVRKFVKPGDIIPLMRTKLYENNIPIPQNDQELIDKYLIIVLNNKKDLQIQNNFTQQFEIIRQAYVNTLMVYGKEQADGAFIELFSNNNVMHFTNRFNDRTNLINIVLPNDVRKIILSNIDINGIDINNVNDILLRFNNSINIAEKQQKIC